MKKFLIIFVFAVHALYSNVSTTENIPSSLVERCVSVISGQAYFVEDDILVQGAEPIRLCRSYISKNGYGSWSLFNHLVAFQRLDSITVPEANGTALKYNYERNKKNIYYFKPLNLNDAALGLTNTARGALSAQTNLKNQTLSIYTTKKNLQLVVHCPDKTLRVYREMYNTPTIKLLGAKLKPAIHYLLISEQLPNGNYILYSWDKNNLLKSIRTTDPTKRITYASVQINHQGKIKEKDGEKYLTNANIDIQTSDGRSLEYLHFRDGKNKYTDRNLLNRIHTTHFPTEDLIYNGGNYHRPSILSEIALPDHRRMRVEYYNPGDNHVLGKNVHIPDASNLLCYRVKALLAPVGLDHTLHVTHSFLYDLNNKNTSIFDCEGHLTKYQWDDDFRLTEIRRFIGEQTPYSNETFAWGTGSDASNLIFKTLRDGSNGILFATHYSYDTNGNVSQEKFYGNLSGESQALSLNSQGLPDTTSSESYWKTHQYSQDGKNLLIRSEEQNGLVTLYEYLPGTNLRTKELICDQERIILRRFFEYDAHHILIREIEDDGSKSSPTDLTDVYQRRIKVITPYREGSYPGMPHIIEERYWDGSSEKLLSKTILHYTKGGNISQKRYMTVLINFAIASHTAMITNVD